RDRADRRCGHPGWGEQLAHALRVTPSPMKTVVVGGGAAGLWAALHASQRGPVALVAPDPEAGSATALAQGGIAAAVAEGDDPQDHAADTLAAGRGLNDAVAVAVLTREAPAAIAELRGRGMAFDAGGAPTLE